MALGGVDMFSRLGGLHSCKVKIRQTFLLFTRKTMHDFDAKKTHCRSRWLGSFLVWLGFGRSDLAGGRAGRDVFLLVRDLRLTFTRVWRGRMAFVDTRIEHCREYSFHGSLSFPLFFVPGVLCCVSFLACFYEVFMNWAVRYCAGCCCVP
jgi:hypothetical protein